MLIVESRAKFICRSFFHESKFFTKFLDFMVIFTLPPPSIFIKNTELYKRLDYNFEISIFTDFW